MKSLLFLVVLVFLASCATMLNDSQQKINVVSSNNTPIKGTIDGVPFAGPGIVAVNRSKTDRIIVVDGETCSKQTLLASQVDTVFWINIFSAGTFGSSTDYSTEKMWRYQDTVVIPCK